MLHMHLPTFLTFDTTVLAIQLSPRRTCFS